MVEREIQQEKAPSSIVLIDCGSMTVVRLKQQQKARFPMVVTDGGIIIVQRSLQL